MFKLIEDSISATIILMTI